MRHKEEFEEIIYKCAGELNKQLPDESKIALRGCSAIFGESSSLDSLGIVMLMIGIEEQVADMGVSVNIMDVLTGSSEPPFITIDDMSLWLFEQSI